MKRFLSCINKKENTDNQFHFVSDYRAWVAHLLNNNDRQTAMSLAVGGNWEAMGKQLFNFSQGLGLKSGMNVLDFACGSGRFAYQLSQNLDIPNYTGIDVVQELLDYAKEICPPHYKFIINQRLSLPTNDSQFDFVFAYSIFTHLLQTEIKIYSDEVYRSLKLGGLFVYSFLEMDKHSQILESSAAAHFAHGRPYPHLNMFLSRDQVLFLARLIGFELVRFIEPEDGIGQTVVVLKKTL